MVHVRHRAGGFAFGSLPVPLRPTNHDMQSKHIICLRHGVKGLCVSSVR